MLTLTTYHCVTDFSQSEQEKGRHGTFEKKANHIVFDDIPLFSVIQEFCYEAVEWLQDEDQVIVLYCNRDNRIAIHVYCLLLSLARLKQDKTNTKEVLAFYCKRRSISSDEAVSPS